MTCVQRSIEDIASRTLLVARSPVYVGDPVDVLVLTQTFWNGLDYHVVFADNEEPRRIDNASAPHNSSLPVWVTQAEFVSSTEFDIGGQRTSADELVWVSATHRYALTGTHVIKLVISGQLTLRGPVRRAEVAVGVVVRDWPSLGDVIGHVTLASQSRRVYVNESVKFVYAVQRVVRNVVYRVHFGNEGEKSVREAHLYSNSNFIFKILCNKELEG